MCSRNSNQRAWAVRTVLFLAACALVLISWAGVNAIREANRIKCRSNLCQIAAGVWAYREKFNAIPPTIVSTGPNRDIQHSWRTVIVNSFDLSGPAVRYDFELPWNSPANESFMTIPEGRIFACPSDSDASSTYRTCYVAVIGENTLWQKDHCRDLKGVSWDVLKNKVLIIEVPSTDILWTQPRDISLDQAIAIFSDPHGLKDCRHPTGLQCITIGAEIRPISSIVDVREFIGKLTLLPNELAPRAPVVANTSAGLSSSVK